MYNSDDVAKKYKEKTGKECHFTTVNSWFNSGKLPGQKIAGRWFAEEKDVEIFLSGESKNSQPDISK